MAKNPPKFLASSLFYSRDFVTLIKMNMFYNIILRRIFMRRLLYSFLFYMVIGLLSGFYYRELTKAHDFVGDTQLSLVHTHTLILGMFMFYSYYHLKSI